MSTTPLSRKISLGNPRFLCLGLKALGQKVHQQFDLIMSYKKESPLKFEKLTQCGVNSDCATKRRITKRRITKRRISKHRIAKRRMAKRRITKRRKLQNVESYRTSTYKTSKIRNVENYKKSWKND
jgi:hypothetical protein